MPGVGFDISSALSGLSSGLQSGSDLRDAALRRRQELFNLQQAQQTQREMETAQAGGWNAFGPGGQGAQAGAGAVAAPPGIGSQLATMSGGPQMPQPQAAPTPAAAPAGQAGAQGGIPPQLRPIVQDTALITGTQVAMQILQKSGGDPAKYLQIRDQGFQAALQKDPSKRQQLMQALQKSQQFRQQLGIQGPQGAPQTGAGGPPAPGGPQPPQGGPAPAATGAAPPNQGQAPEPGSPEADLALVRQMAASIDKSNPNASPADKFRMLTSAMDVMAKAGALQKNVVQEVIQAGHDATRVQTTQMHDETLQAVADANNLTKVKIADLNDEAKVTVARMGAAERLQAAGISAGARVDSAQIEAGARRFAAQYGGDVNAWKAQLQYDASTFHSQAGSMGTQNTPPEPGAPPTPPDEGAPAPAGRPAPASRGPAASHRLPYNTKEDVVTAIKQGKITRQQGLTILKANPQLLSGG